MTNYLYTAAQCREIDRLAMQSLGLQGIQLMQRAAEAAMDVLTTCWPEVQSLYLYCGPGNNGGDGYLLAAMAYKLGYRVRVCAVLPPASELAIKAHAIAIESGLSISALGGRSELPADPSGGLIIDAIFGHGLARPLQGNIAELVHDLNQSKLPLLALDVPSGINSDSGAVMGCGLHADVSCSFIAPKRGMYTGAGPDYAGDIYEVSLGVPPQIYAGIRPACEVITLATIRPLLPLPRLTSHKGDFGHVGVIGGQPGMVGAVILSGLAAARSGAGRVTILSDSSHIHLIQQANPVLMTRPIDADGHLDLPDTITALALGPGLGCPLIPNREEADQSSKNWSIAVFEAALSLAEERRLALLVDADALGLLAALPRRSSRWVLSPHPKEAAILLGMSVAQVEADRPAVCEQIAQRYGGICVLKGKGSLISDGGTHLSICSAGNWGMATAGSGDVLSGIIAAFLGSGIPAYNAARLGVAIHAQAGDSAATVLAMRAMIATDLIDHLSGVLKQFEAPSYDLYA